MASQSPSSLCPLRVPMEIHVINRAKLLKYLRQYLTESSRPLHGFVLLQGGEEQTRHDTDHVELFRQESYFAYLFGVKEPGFYGAIVGSFLSHASFLVVMHIPIYNNNVAKRMDNILQIAPTLTGAVSSLRLKWLHSFG